jgi:hypothetical protein
MRSHNEIRNEQDPILREIWAAGYDQVIFDHCAQEYILVTPNIEKRIPKNALSEHNFTIINSVLIDGSGHSWVKEADGSCERLRQLIKPNENHYL